MLAESGEDAIAFCPQSDYAANVELAEALAPGARPAAREAMRKVATPGKTKCEVVAELLGIALQRTVKAVALMHDRDFILLVVRAVWFRIQPLNTPPGPAGGSWNTTSAPATGLSALSRTSTISGAALRVRMLFNAPSPCTTTIFRSPPGPLTTCCAWHDRAMSARNI